MSLLKWYPDNSILPSISSWMDDFIQTPGFKPMVSGISIPAVNVKESKSAFKMDVAAPGFKKEDFIVEVKDGFLNISAEAKEEKEEQDESYTRKEYSYQNFSRTFNLPENVAGEDVSAQYTDGILKVTIPKKKTAEKAVQQITVK